MRYLIRLAAAVALMLLLAAPALAQGQLILEDPEDYLDDSAIQSAARPLINKGAAVAVYFVQSGGTDDFTERMIDSGIMRADGAMLSNVIAIYVALDERYSEIAYGDQWSDALYVNENAELIRRDQLNPGLADGEYSRSIESGLSAINNAIENPPVPGGGTNVNTAPIAYGLIGIATVGAGGLLVVNRRRAAKKRADAQGRLKDAREGAGAVIADLGRRFNDANEKAKFDKVSYTAEDVARVQKAQQAAAARFVKVQEQFDNTGEDLERREKPTNEQLIAAAGVYDQVKAEAVAVGEDLKAVEDLRTQLDAQARQAREEIDRAKKS